MRSGWVSGWCVRPSFPVLKTCTGIGTAAWSMTSSKAAFVFAAVVLCGAAHAAEAQLFEAVEPHMGTLVRIQVYADSAAQANAGFRAAFDRIAQLDDALSDYKPDSELNRLCRTAVGVWATAGPDLFR